MTKMKKALIGTAAAAAMAVSANPAVAKDRYDDDGISTGEVIAGALVIGGIAAIAAAASDNDDRYDRRYRDRYDRDDRYYRGGRYDYNRAGYNNYTRISQRGAVNQCVRAVERHLRRAGRADVTQIRDVDRTRYGYRVKGRVVLQSRYNDDRGRFTCTTNGRGNPALSFRGLFNGR